MSCREEYSTESNGVAEDRLLCAIRLDYIAAVWDYRRTVKYNDRVAEHNRIIEEMNDADERHHKFEQKYWFPWIDEVWALLSELDVLIRKWEMGEHVTPADWDAITAGKERKVTVIVDAKVPLELWPLPVREHYPNLIELLSYEMEQVRQGNHENNFAAAVESIANQTSVNANSKQIQTCYKKQYREIVKHFAQQDTGTMTLKCIGGQSSGEIEQQTPMTAERIEQMREQLKIGRSIFDMDVDDTLSFPP